MFLTDRADIGMYKCSFRNQATGYTDGIVEFNVSSKQETYIHIVSFKAKGFIYLSKRVYTVRSFCLEADDIHTCTHPHTHTHTHTHIYSHIYLSTGMV